MRSFIGLSLLAPALVIDLILWVLGGWTKGTPFDMPVADFVWRKFL